MPGFAHPPTHTTPSNFHFYWVPVPGQVVFGVVVLCVVLLLLQHKALKRGSD